MYSGVRATRRIFAMDDFTQDGARARTEPTGWPVRRAGLMRFRRRLALAAAGLAVVALGALIVPNRISTSTASTGPDCGARIAKGLGTFWRCTFVDNFSGTSLDTGKWSPMLTARTGVPSPECRVSSPNNISVHDGTLSLTVRKEPEPFTCISRLGSYVTQYTGGAVTTYNKFSQAYGRFAFRAKFPDPKVPGLHSALWMWPQHLTYGHGSGELDIAEFRTAIPDRVAPYIHYAPAVVDPNVTTNSCAMSTPDAFHTYVMEWTPTSIRFLYDGKLCLVDTNWRPRLPLLNPAPFDKPFTINMNQSLGVGGNQIDPDTTPLPATMQVDWVKVWS
jgi:beta-glucanase (GH16 family)